MKIALIFGTRPEAIKMAPVYLKMKELGINVKIIATAQHREMLDQVFEIFKIKPEYDLNIMKHGQQLPEMTSRLITSIDEVLKKERFDYILVHGDTTSTMAGSIAGFYNKIKVCHVEAGLRTNDIYNPYPEEMNRRITGTIANYHFAPTKRAKENLLNEGIDENNIIITGNTVIDALLWVEKNKKNEIERIKEKYELKGKKYILMTMHRRENWGNPMKNTLRAVKKYLIETPDITLVFPVHLNPKVRDIVNEELKGLKNVMLIEPVEYLEFISLMDGCHYIMTDSGGIQEEAPSLGKPTVVLRKTTERPEAIDTGTALLAGTDFDNVYNTMKELEGELYKKMSNTSNPFGDGNASKIICDFLNSL